MIQIRELFRPGNPALISVFAAALTAPLVHGASTYPIKDFVSSGTPNGDRSFISTKFVGTTTEFTTANIGYFQDGLLKWPAVGASPAQSYGWTDPIPGDFGSGNLYALNPDRGDNATPYAGEANNPKSGTLKEVFGQSNLGYLMDGETGRTFTLDLLYRQSGYITYDGTIDSPELLVLERGQNSGLGVRAILEGGLYSTDFLLDFRNSADQAGVADYSINTMEIDAAQRVNGIGLGLNAFGLATGTKVFGYQFFVDEANKNSFDGPDFIGFVAGRTVPTPTALPEASPIHGAAALLGLGVMAAIRRRRQV